MNALRSCRNRPFIRALALAFICVTVTTQPLAAQGPPRQLVVGATGDATTIAQALAMATPGSHIRVTHGLYREHDLQINVPLTLVADSAGTAIVDAEGQGSLFQVRADDVTVRGFTLRNTGPSQLGIRAGVHAQGVSRCMVEHNRIEDALFGVYLDSTSNCTARHNQFIGSRSSQMTAGNAIHAWSSSDVQVFDNVIEGHRDGIYFEFVRGGVVARNTVTASARYGMHFMFSHDCTYTGNVFHDNGNGVAVMYSRHVTMHRNTFSENHGSAAYGLLLKDISDSELIGNIFTNNSIGLYLEDSNRNRMEGNAFTGNGWAVRVLGSADSNYFVGNDFVRNTFDVSTNSRRASSTLRENYWDSYRGYDLNRDGFGDVPHAPVRLFALLVERSPSALLLLRSVLVELLDFAERMIPTLTPVTLVDTRPRLTPARTGDSAKGALTARSIEHGGARQ